MDVHGYSRIAVIAALAEDKLTREQLEVLYRMIGLILAEKEA